MSQPAQHPRTAGPRVQPLIVSAAVISLVLGFGYGMATTAIASNRSTTSSESVRRSINLPSGSANTASFDYSGTYSGALTADGATKTAASTTVESTTADTNTALSENGGSLKISNAKLNKSGDSSNADNTNFYGTNAISLTVGENSTTSISNSTLSSSSSGSNGVFATDSGTALVNNVTINTTADNSRGLDATYGGTILAGDLTISTKGEHSAGVATDRGGGSVSVNKATISTAGSGSPILYSTGDIQVANVKGTASSSQIAGMEGYNTILIKDSELTSTNTGKTASDPIANGIIIYQSTSGDAETSTGEHATFQAADSTLSSSIESGSMFYFTNTTADVVLSNTTLNFDSSKAALITAAGNDSNNWGSAGSNGATVTFTGRNQKLNGKVSVDTISSVTLNLAEGSTWTGSAEIAKNANATTTSESPLTVAIDGTSTWVVTADTTVTNLHMANGAKLVDSSGKTVSVVKDGKTLVKGDSELTVTVTGTYDTTVSLGSDTELATSMIDRSDYDGEFDTKTTWTMA